MKINRVLIYLIISDILIWSAYGLILPIFAIFIKEGISGGSILAVGIASSIFLLTKSILQLPLSWYIDTKKGKLGFVLVGTFLVVLTPFLYAFSPSINFIFLAQFIHGMGAAMAYPAWMSLFVMHLDRKHRGFEWALWSTGVGLGVALTAYIGARFVEGIGFQNLFLIVSGIAFTGMLVLFLISKKYLKGAKKVGYFILPRDHTK